MSRRTACLWSIGLFLGAVLLVCLHRPLLHVLEALPLPDCIFYRTTGWLCPACGNTRAVLALCKGQVLRSLGCNPMIGTLCAALLCRYAELVCTAIGKPRQILPRRTAALVIVLAIVLGYDIVRNFFRRSHYANKNTASQTEKRCFFMQKTAFKFHDCVAWRSSDGSLHGSGQPDCDSTA